MCLPLSKIIEDQKKRNSYNQNSKKHDHDMMNTFEKLVECGLVDEQGHIKQKEE